MLLAQTQSFRIDTSQKNISFSILQILGASFLLILCSYISIPLYFSRIPLSAQTFGVMLIGATMGSRMGVLSVLAYLAEGCLGLPVFAGGHFGLMSLLGVKGGYIVGFILQVYFVGYFMERQVSFQITKTLSILLISCALQLSLGVLWLSLFVGLKSAMVMGLYPFIIGEVIKAISITTYLKAKNS